MKECAVIASTARIVVIVINMLDKRLPFNKWSRERIKQGKKLCTSRSERYADSRVEFVFAAPLWFVKKYLWRDEGANSPEEFEEVWKNIHRGIFDAGRIVYVHYGNFKKD